MTVEQHAAGIFTLSWCPRAGWGTALKFLFAAAPQSHDADSTMRDISSIIGHDVGAGRR